MKLLRVKLEYWLPGITMWASEPGSQLTSALNKIKLLVRKKTEAEMHVKLKYYHHLSR